MNDRPTRREFLTTAAKGAALGLLAPGLLRTYAAGAAEPKRRPNVLFIAVDDLRPQLGCYGQKEMLSPNIDKLASRGILFERAYCQEAICAASRCSLLSGCRPDTTRIYDLETPLRKAMPDVLSLPQHFRNNGYTTISLGKIYHHRNDDKPGWSQPPGREKGEWLGRGYLDEESKRLVRERNAKQAGKDAAKLGLGPAFEGPDVKDNEYPDGAITEQAIAEMRRLKDQPFFLAVGYYKPHLPFNSPKRYWDLYDAGRIHLPANSQPPKDSPALALTNWGELRAYTGIPQTGPCGEELSRKLIHAYYACVSFTDAQIGRLLGELETLKLAESTVIVLWGDHGWKLGEYGSWCKHTNVEYDTRVPMIFAGPGVPGGARTDALSEFVDIYPTLAELTGLAVPAHCEGLSLTPLMKDPKRPWKQAAFSQYPRGAIMGYSMRTDRYRYTRWQNRKTGQAVATELYDHQTDPGENTNVVADASRAELLRQLDAQLTAGWKAARPK